MQSQNAYLAVVYAAIIELHFGITSNLFSQAFPVHSILLVWIKQPGIMILTSLSVSSWQGALLQSELPEHRPPTNLWIRYSSHYNKRTILLWIPKKTLTNMLLPSTNSSSPCCAVVVIKWCAILSITLALLSCCTGIIWHHKYYLNYAW